MYNRYIRSEDGSYTRVSEEEQSHAPPPPRGQNGGAPPESGASANDPPPFGGIGGAEGIAAYLRRVLDQLHLDRIDTGDLLLLGLLYFLFREKADEELLVALGLLLIL